MRTVQRITMTASTDHALYRLMAWLSPSYPVGAFSYSHGLERAIEQGDVATAESLCGWINDVLRCGSGRTDAILFAHAWRAAASSDAIALATTAELATALAASRERHLETTAQGKAFVAATRSAWQCPALDRLQSAWRGDIAYPIAVACAAAGHAVPLTSALVAYLHAWGANLVSAGVRLIPLGQSDGLRVIARLEPAVHTTARGALDADLDDVGGACVLADIASMRHETQHTRLFRT